MEMCTGDSRFFGLEEHYDARIRTDDGYCFPIHRIELASESEFFKDLLFDSRNEPQQDHLVPGVGGETMKNILSYVYSKKLTVDADNVCDLLMACDALAVKRLLKKCCDSVHQLISPSKCLEFLRVASGLDDLKLYDHCFYYCRSRFTVAVERTAAPALQALPQHVLQHLLASDLNVSDEQVVWDVVVLWISGDPAQRTGLAAELLSYIRWEDASQQLVDKVAGHDYVLGNASCAQLLSAAGQGGASGITEKDNLVREVRELWPTRRLDARCPPGRFLRGREHMTAHTIRLELSFDNSFFDKQAAWFLLGEVPYHANTAVTVGHTVVMFNTWRSEPGFGFDLVEGREFELPPLEEAAAKHNYIAVALENSVYCIFQSTVRRNSTRFSMDRHKVATSPTAHNFTYTMARYELEADHWELDARPPPDHFQVHAAVAHEGVMYALGRSTEYGGLGPAAQKYDPRRNSWKALSRPLIDDADRRARLFACDGRLFHFQSYHRPGVEMYDVRRDAWTVIKDIPVTPSRAVAVNGHLVVSERDLGAYWMEEDDHWQHYDIHDKFVYKESFILEIVDAEANRLLRKVIQKDSYDEEEDEY